MITWKDFVLDDRTGPYLIENEDQQNQWKQTESSSVMDDAKGLAVSTIQETGQEQRTARMVGATYGLDSSTAEHLFGTEANLGDSRSVNPLKRQGAS